MTSIPNRRPFAWAPIPRALPPRLLPIWVALWEVSDPWADATHVTNLEIADVIGVSIPTVIRGLRGLERLGLIRRELPGDGGAHAAIRLLYKDELRRQGGEASR